MEAQETGSFLSFFHRCTHQITPMWYLVVVHKSFHCLVRHCPYYGLGTYFFSNSGCCNYISSPFEDLTTRARNLWTPYTGWQHNIDTRLYLLCNCYTGAVNEALISFKIFSRPSSTALKWAIVACFSFKLTREYYTPSSELVLNLFHAAKAILKRFKNPLFLYDF